MMTFAKKVSPGSRTTKDAWMRTASPSWVHSPDKSSANEPASEAAHRLDRLHVFPPTGFPRDRTTLPDQSSFDAPESTDSLEAPEEPLMDFSEDEATSAVDETDTGAGGPQGEPFARAEPTGATAAATSASPKVAASGTNTVIRGPREMWFFDGETPAGYRVATAVSTNRSGGAFQWSVSPQLSLSSPTAAQPLITTTGPSAAARDAWIRIRHTDAGGASTAASYRLTVRAPTSLHHLRNIDVADPTWGYDTQIHYSIRDQFGTQLPRNVPINEDFTSGITADTAGMDWRRGAEGSATVSPADWFDHIQGETAGHTPTPVGPAHADAGTAVYHWRGEWNVGSLTIGSGRHVATVTWQKNRGFARHT